MIYPHHDEIFKDYPGLSAKATRGGDFTSHNKVHQQAHLNLNVRPPTGSDGAKTTQVGNFQVLNREKNGIRDDKSVINPTSLVPSAGVPSLKSPTDQKLRVEKNGRERKLTSHAQNRNDFFNLLRKKSLARSSVTPEPCSLDRSLSLEKSDAEDLQMSSPVNLRRKNVNCLAGDLFASDGSERYYTGNGETNPYLDIVVDPEEEAFLQSLGWDKNAWEEALTKEEIDAFLKKYEKQRDSNGLTAENNELKLRLQTMEQQVHLQDALNEALREEVQRLKLATGQMLPNGGQMKNFVPSSFGANQQYYHQNHAMQSLLAAHQFQQLQIHSQHPKQLQPHQAQQHQAQLQLHSHVQQQQSPSDLRMKGPLPSQNRFGETSSNVKKE